MFYDEFCSTEYQKTVFKAIVDLSVHSCYISIQDLSYLGIPQTELKEILKFFELKGLFKNVQHLVESYPVLFSLK